MAEELIQGGFCGDNWWNPARSLFSSSPCSAAINDMGSSFGWPILSNDEFNSDSDHIGQKSNLEMTGIDLSSSTSEHWNHQDFLQENGISERNCSLANQNQNSRLNNQQQSRIDSHQLNQMDWNSKDFSTDSAFPLNSASNSYTLYTSSFLQSLFDSDTDQPQQSLSPKYNPVKSNEVLPSLPKPSTLQPHNHLPFSSTTNGVIASFFPSSTLDWSSPETKKSSDEPAFKRSRIETPSPLPTFKVRKEKLGDRITALQQLVSPFGKTDTASVLQEAIEYIKFLHDQVSVLSTSYMKNPYSVHCQQGSAYKHKDGKGSKQELKGRGLCLVPMLSTFPLAAEMTSDFWNPTFRQQN